MHQVHAGACRSAFHLAGMASGSGHSLWGAARKRKAPASDDPEEEEVVEGERQEGSRQGGNAAASVELSAVNEAEAAFLRCVCGGGGGAVGKVVARVAR